MPTFLVYQLYLVGKRLNFLEVKHLVHVDLALCPFLPHGFNRYLPLTSGLLGLPEFGSILHHLHHPQILLTLRHIPLPQRFQLIMQQLALYILFGSHGVLLFICLFVGADAVESAIGSGGLGTRSSVRRKPLQMLHSTALPLESSAHATAHRHPHLLLLLFLLDLVENCLLEVARIVVVCVGVRGGGRCW